MRSRVHTAQIRYSGSFPLTTAVQTFRVGPPGSVGNLPHHLCTENRPENRRQIEKGTLCVGGGEEGPKAVVLSPEDL